MEEEEEEEEKKVSGGLFYGAGARGEPGISECEAAFCVKVATLLLLLEGLSGFLFRRMPFDCMVMAKYGNVQVHKLISLRDPDGGLRLSASQFTRNTIP